MARSPIWKSIAATIGDEIAKGHYGPGDKLPTEAALSARFGVNRHTVRHALSDMAERGLVRARRGAGRRIGGEVVIGGDMAKRVAGELGVEPSEEVILYLVHGLLHLCGYDDLDDLHRRQMRRREAELLEVLELRVRVDG